MILYTFHAGYLKKYIVICKSNRHFCDSLPINKVQAHLKHERSQIIRAICREFLSLFYKGCDIERGNSKFSLPRFHYLIRLGKAASSHDDINVTLSHKDRPKEYSTRCSRMVNLREKSIFCPYFWSQSHIRLVRLFPDSLNAIKSTIKLSRGCHENFSFIGATNWPSCSTV